MTEYKLANIDSIEMDSGCVLYGGDVLKLISEPMVNGSAVRTIDNNGKYIIALNKVYFIGYLRIYNANTGNAEFINTSPKHIILYGKKSLTDNWTQITEITNNPPSTGYFDIYIDDYYKYLKLYTVKNNGYGSNLIGIRAIRIYIGVDNCLLKYNNQYYSIKPEFYDAELQQYNPLETISFENQAFSVNELFKEMKIGEEEFAPIDKFNFFSLMTDDLKINYRLQGLKYTYQLVVASDDIPTSIASNIDSFTLTSNSSLESDVKLALSTDKGKTWKTWNANNSSFDNLLDCTIPLKSYESLTATELIQWNNAMNDISTNGITPEIFNTLDFNLLNAKYIRFAYVLSRPKYEGVAETSQLNWQFDAKGSMRKMTDSEHLIDVYEHEIKVTTLTDNPLIKVNVMA